MAHKHSVRDTDNHFMIDGVTRAVKNVSETKTMLVQHDHNSERFTFEIPRYIDGHDMSTCNSVQVHYINIDSKTAKTANPLTCSGVYEVDDIAISPESNDVVICSWLISGKATQYVGNLSFIVRFACTSDGGKIDYVWNTARHGNVFVTEGIYNGNVVAEQYVDILEQWRQKLSSGGFMTIAHRGYYPNCVENTTQAIINAASVGYEWVEIDIRKCADGQYVLSHDATVKLYSGGQPVSVTIESSNYSDIRGYTWDASGKYPLCTLRAAFATMRQYGVKAVCDRVTGTYADILSIAGTSGMLDSVMLSFWNHYVANGDSALLNKHKYIPIRIAPNDFAGIQAAMTALHNPIYADVYTDSIAEIKYKLPLALALNMPIIVSGCTTANVERWAGVASGAMTQGGVQFTPADFHNCISADFDVLCNIAVTREITVEAEGSVEVVATSDVDSVAGYIYAYSTTPGIVSVEQTQFGSSAKITITGLAAGAGDVRVFTPSGAMADISVTVSGERGTIITGYTVIKGSFDGSGRGGYLPASINAVRACLNPCMLPVNTGDIVRFTIPDGYALGPSLMVVPDNSADYTLTETDVAGKAAVYFDVTQRTADPGWKTVTYDLEVTSGNVFGVNIKRSDGGTITDEDIANLQAGLSIEIL